MSRNGSGVYSLPGGSTITNGDTSDATDLNTPLQDLESDMNVARPIVAGGTGSTSASAARTALGVAIGSDVQAFGVTKNMLEVLEPISDTNTLTFTTDISTYDEIEVEFVGNISALEDLSLQISDGGSTWRFVAGTTPASQNMQLTMHVKNIKDTDGTGIVRGSTSAVTTLGSFDRSDAGDFDPESTSTKRGGYQSRTAFLPDQARLFLANSATFEGSNADSRCIAILYGTKWAT